ncbi:MAG: TIM44-like domain-containing protein [Lachnospirales bacterium]
MTKKIDKRLLFFISLVIFILLFLTINIFAADVGNSFSGGGSSSRGSSSRYSSGYSGGGDSFFLYYLLFSLPFPYNIIVWALIVGGAFIFRNKRPVRSQVTPVQSQPQKYFINENAEIVKIRSDDPNFSKNEFISYVNDVYIRVQEAWEEKKWESIRPFESNELFNTHNKQLQEYIINKTVLHLDKQEILETQIARFERDGNYEFITVKLTATLLAYLTDENGKVLEGSPKNRVYREYELKFKRSKGVKTSSQRGTNTTNCPNCGAPSQVTSSGKCEYCNSVITTGDYSWVLDKFGQWRV